MAKMKKKSLSDEWEQIAQKCIEAAERVECEFADFVEGLRSIEHDIKERRQLAEAELDKQADGAMQDDDGDDD